MANSDVTNRERKSNQTSGSWWAPWQTGRSPATADFPSNQLSSSPGMNAINAFLETRHRYPAGAAEERVFYARVGQTEYDVPSDKEPPRTFVRFEAFSQAWFDVHPPPDLEGSDQESYFLRYYAEAAVYVLELEFHRDHTGRFPILKDLLNAAESDVEPEEWYRITAGASSSGEEPPLTVYPNLFLEGTRLNLQDIEGVEEKTSAFLEKAVDTSQIPDATAEELEEALAGASGSTIDHLVSHAVVYDVGQGNAIGLVSDRRGPIVYFDLGGGTGANSGSFPPALNKFCFYEDPTIILSHWDEDHWSSANRDTDALKQKWIAPRQKVGPSQRAMMAAISANGGTILFLPSGYPKTRYGQMQLELATGSGRNHSGIVLTLAENSDGSGEQILMPGDASYHHIASFTGGAPYLSVVASHHGGLLKSGSIPHSPGGIPSRLVYSAGNPNTYKHPLPATRGAHDAVGWIDPAVTPVAPASGAPLVRETSNRTIAGFGHVLLTWSPTSITPAMSCGCTQLDPQQT